MRIAFVGVLLLSLGCSKQERNGTDPGPGPQTPATVKVTGTISSVTLGEDCGKSAAAGAPSLVAPKISAATARAIAADCPQGVDCSESFCKQTSMQLALEGGPTGSPVVVTIAHVELFDSKGASLGVLTTRDPQIFDAPGAKYLTWDGKVSAAQRAGVMFKLSAPDWSKIGGQWQAQGKSFRLAVTLDVGGHKVELEKSAEVMIEPPVVT